MKVTLQQDDGREISLEKIEDLVREDRYKKELAKQNKNTMRPLEGVPFEVNPQELDRNLFRTERKDALQEETRREIIHAFNKMYDYPEVGKPFQTLIPEKAWDSITACEAERIAEKHGGQLARWYEQAFEWAQRIQNGETWETICNEPDPAIWKRLVVWYRVSSVGYTTTVGGSVKRNSKYGFKLTPSFVNVQEEDWTFKEKSFEDAVPLIVIR